MDTLNDSKKGILSFLQNSEGEDFDKCDILFKIISAANPEHQGELFQYVCEVFGTVKSYGKESIPISEYNAQKQRLEEQYGDIVNSLIKTYCQQNEEEHVFYCSLWSLINESLIFDTEAKKVLALYFILIDKRIPYFKIDESLLYSMSNNRFGELLQKTALEGQKIRFILKADISQKSERAAVLLNELGIKLPADGDQKATDEYEIRLMQMVYILREMDSNRLASLLSRLQN